MRAQPFGRLAVAILIVATFAFMVGSEEGCAPDAVMYGSFRMETEDGDFEVEVCVSDDEVLGQLVYVFTLTNIDACALESLMIEPFASRDAVQLEPTTYWQPVFEEPYWWGWEGPFWHPLHPGYSMSFTVRSSDMTPVTAFSCKVTPAGHMTCGATSYRLTLQSAEARTAPAIDGKYLIAFNDRDCNLPGIEPEPEGQETGLGCRAPRYSRVHLLQSDDGAEWRTIPGFEPFAGGIPDGIRRGNTLYLYANLMDPSQWGLRVLKYDFDTNMWIGPHYVEVSGGREPFLPFTPGKEFPVGQTAILDDNGRLMLLYRLYYVAWGAQPVEYFRTATEVPGSDGTKFVVDPGERIKLVQDLDKEYIGLGNGEIFRDPDGYGIYFGYGRFTEKDGTALESGIAVWRSEELRGTYKPTEALPCGILTEFSGSAAGGGYVPAAGQYWTFVIPPGRVIPGRITIWRAVHSSLDEQLADASFEQVIDFEELVGLERTYMAPGAGLMHPSFILNEP